MMHHRNRISSVYLVSWVGIFVMGFLPADSCAEDVSIVGQRSPDNRFDYCWTLTNHTDKRITMLRVDHYYGKMVTPPKGWVLGEMTGNWAEEGQSLEPGIIEYRVEEPRKAISRNQTREFHVMIDRVWRGFRKRRTVTVGFADGTTMKIPGVLCPAEEDWLKQNIALVGLGAMFASFVLARLIFGKKKSEESPADNTATKNESKPIDDSSDQPRL